MFYSEQLLSKTGPLARVWLASNVERKLSKSQILQSDISSSVGVIVGEDQAPMALRLSGQLMLGVVRIYGRKARYLLDDCNEALLKIRMTFKPMNSHDLPAHAMSTVDLNLPEMLTIDDLFPAMDFDFALTQQPVPAHDDRMIDIDEDWASSLAPQRSTQSFLTPDEPNLGADDLGLDFGDDIGPDDTTISLQVGRTEHTPRPDNSLEGPAIFDDADDLGLDFGDDTMMPEAPTDEPAVNLEARDDVPTLDGDETAQIRTGTAEFQRDLESPLSEAGSEFMREIDQTLAEEELGAIAPQNVRRQKPLVADKDTVLHNSELKAYADDRSKILRPASFLPKDPVLLALMNMQKSGDFVTNGMNDGRSRNWAPELQGLLSFEVVYRSGQAKRKRDSGIADLSDDEHSNKSPRLEYDMADMGANLLEDEGVMVGQESPIPIAETAPTAQERSIAFDDDEDPMFTGEGDFDETTMPLVHPADNGPVSLSTKRAVHLLRDTFGTAQSDTSPSSQSKKSILLQEFIPEDTTTREQATKMFFEVLVLATKDAIKVDQNDKQIGLPLRIRAKRGLWGTWAEATPSDNATSQEEVVTIG